MRALIAGFGTTALRQCFDEPSMVTLHRLGTDQRAYFTPDEARALAKALVDAAKKAEEK